MAVIQTNQNENGTGVRVLLGEPEGGLRHAMRAALTREGYGTVDDYDRSSTLKEALIKSDHDLVILDSEMDTGEADQLITELRYNRIGKNPFVPVIVTIWNPTQEQVRRVASSGTDDMLVKPISPMKVFERIKALVNARKPFVVTSDYIGPDRRKDVSRGSEIPTIDVPNTLRSKVKGEPIVRADLEVAIKQAQGHINDERMKRNAFQIGFLVQLLLPELEKPTVSEERIRSVEKLATVSKDIGDRVRGTEFEHVSSLCSAMGRVATSIGKHIEEPTQKDKDLLKPLSEAILTAFNPNTGTADLAHQISGAITSYKKRTGV